MTDAAAPPPAGDGDGGGGEGGERRRRRRRRGGGGGAAAAEGGDAQPKQPRPPQQQQQQQRREPQRREPQQQQRGQRNQPARGQQQQPRGAQQGKQRDQRRRDDGRNRQRHETRDQVGGEGSLHDDDDILRDDPYRSDAPARAPARPTPVPVAEVHDDEPHTAPAVAWGTEDDSPAPEVTLAPDLPVDAPADDPDPLTFPLVDGPGAQLGDDVASVVGVRFVPAGRIQWADAGDGDFAPGERVMVDSDRGPRLAWIATAPTRKATRDRGLRRVIRRANEQDLRADQTGDAERQRALRIAKDTVAALRLPMKIFRVEGGKPGTKLNIYYTSEDERARLDLRDFVRDVGQATGMRLELRQLGVRDEAKAVGGIGSCGLTLCCTTWLPDFVPVSIKMAKDQGLVLSPTKVSGQCGRLKCCLVYEQAGYAELRKGLPKLGKRVITQRGDGRVVEVDVLRQRVRVSYGAGDTEVLPATDVKPMFPSGNQPRAHEVEHEPDADEPDLPQS